MRTFYSLTKRQFLGMTKFNKFLYGNSKEKKVFAYTFFAISLTAIILFFCWFRMAFQICMTFQYPQEIFKYLLKPFVVVSIFMTFLSALIKGSGICNYSAPRLGYINFWSKQRKYNFCFIIALLRKVDNFSM